MNDAMTIALIKSYTKKYANNIQVGGGGLATFLYRAEVTEPVRAISIPFQEEWKKYFAILAVPRNLKPNTTEWLCYTNSVTGIVAYLGTGGQIGASEFNPQHSRMVITFSEDGCYSYQNQGQLKIDANGLKSLMFSTYYAQNTFDSGVLELYGVML